MGTQLTVEAAAVPLPEDDTNLVKPQRQRQPSVCYLLKLPNELLYTILRSLDRRACECLP